MRTGCAMEKNDFIAACLEQVKWKRYRDGSYSSSDPYLAVQDTLRSMRSGDDIALGKAELLLLLQATTESIRYIQKHTHLPETLSTAQALRDELHQMAHWGHK